MVKTASTRPPRPDRLFRALADPTRLAILRLLRTPGGANACGAARTAAGAGAGEARERCVCELVEALRVPQPTASRHLAYLRRAGLVEARKQGPWSYYRLSTPRNPLHRRLLDCLECCGDACGRGPRAVASPTKGAGRSGKCC